MRGGKSISFSEAVDFDADCAAMARGFSATGNERIIALDESLGVPVQQRNVGVIYPGQEVVVTVPWYGTEPGKPLEHFREQLEPDQLSALGAQYAYFVIVMRIRYRDSFGGWHKTLYCARWQPPSDELLPFDYGNYAD
jgi:hypothetical protein